ncbi:MAG: chromate transporter [Clostridiales bacterium]|nr:chromate transporter [Clostridiales bacterium]
MKGRSGMEQALSRSQKLWKLFVTSLYISAFTFGGGFVIITFMKRKYVDEFHWIDEQEMLDLTALAQTSPGAIAVNAAILVGWRVGGGLGAAAAVLGTIIPPVLIILVISLFYAAFAANKYVALVLKGMQAGVAAVILDVVCNLGMKVAARRSILDLFIFLGAFAATFFFKVNVVFIILIAGLIGVSRAILLKPKGVEK